MSDANGNGGPPRGRGARPEIDLGFGDELAERKRELGLSFETLAQRAGVSRSYLQDITAHRRGYSWPSQELVDRIAAALGVASDYFTITKARAVLEERQVLDVAYSKVKSVRRLRAKRTAA
jgi:transcriptional regulator with XRE-family HTH domain